MPPKKNANPVAEKVEELYPLVTPLDYLVNNLLTMIELLASKNEEIRLRSIGRLHKCFQDNDDLVDFILKNCLYPKFVVPLKTSNIYILRFTLAVWKMFFERFQIGNIDIDEFKEEDFLTFCDFLRTYLVEQDDLMITNLSLEVIHWIFQFTKKNINFFGTIEVITKLFDMITSTTEFEIQKMCLEIFYILLETNSIQDFLIYMPNFSLELWLCFILSAEDHPFKMLIVRIVHKMSCWTDRKEYLKFLFDKKIMEISTNLMLENNDFTPISYEILYNMLNGEGFDVEYVKTLEFLKFLEWSRNCLKINQHIALNLITKLTRNDDLHQVFFDFGLDVILETFIENYQESTLPNLLESIENLSRHMYMCFKMTNPAVLNGLIKMIKNPSISAVPYGELVLKTLHRFFKCNPLTVEVICTTEGLEDLLESFYVYANLSELTQSGFDTFLEIIQFIVRSRFVKKLQYISFYDVTTRLFCSDKEYVVERALKIVQELVNFGEYRDYFLAKGGLKLIFNLLSSTSYTVIYGLLLVIKFFVKFKKSAYYFVDKGLIGRLIELNENLKSKTVLCEEILDTLYDMCLTIKFFYTDHLSVSDKIRDQFYLMPDDLLRNEKHVEINELTTDQPIYYVQFGSILKFKSAKLKLLRNDKEKKPQTKTENEKETSTTRCLSIVPSFLAFKFVQELNKEPIEHISNQNKHRKKCEDVKLGDYIREIYQELNFGKLQKVKKQEKISYIAKYVVESLNDFNRNEPNKRHSLKMHLIHLKDVLKSNFIPIGYLRMGLSRERALLFKVICDQVGVPVTLNRHKNGVLWNGFTVIKSNPRTCSEAVISVDFLVDLMANVGEIIPVNTPYCDKYFEYFSNY
ncbi:armadillo repeat-containing protein 3 [Onthophagus taurus]|uniref:armadillo repeat-containing protein 3 n=1 Tax=Onthophagus taurus TaxID=166361 RepID=UPI0039BE974E